MANHSSLLPMFPAVQGTVIARHDVMAHQVSGDERSRAFLTLRAAGIVAALAVTLLVLWQVRAFVLLLFFAALLAIPLATAVTFLHRRVRVRRSIGLAIVVLALGGVVYGLGALLAAPIASQMEEVRQQLPQAVDRVEAWLNGRPVLGRVVLGGSEVSADAAGGRDGVAGPADGDPQSLEGRAASQLRRHAGTLFPFVMTTVTAVSGVLLAFFLTLYLAAEPKLYVLGLLRVVPVERRPRVLGIAREVATTLNRWLAAQGVSMLVIGVISTVTLYFLDVKAALALGVLAGLSEFVPVFGPILSAIPAIGIAFVDSPTKALYVLIAYVVIQQVESNVVSPLVMKRGVDVPPVVTILAGTLMTILFGFLGLLVAVPIAAALLTVAREITPEVEHDLLSEG